MGLFNWFRQQSKKESINMLSGQESTSNSSTFLPTKNKAIARQKNSSSTELSKLLQNNRLNTAINYACQLLTQEHYHQSIDSFEQIMLHAPNQKGLCENQIGAAYFFLDQYDKAIEAYLRSLDYGFDIKMLDYNIWEAAEVHFQNSGDNSLIKVYLQYFPNGNASTTAQQLLEQ